MAPLFHLLGYPGTGKLTIAHAMQARLEAHGRPGRVVDNHYVNDVVFGLLDSDLGVPDEAWARVGEVWDAVLKTMETLSPPEWWFVVTNYLNEREDDALWMDRLALVARRRGSEYLPVRLLCSPDELLRRVADPARKASHKITDPAMVQRMVDSAGLLTPTAPRTLTLDVTELSPNAAAKRILAHADKRR